MAQIRCCLTSAVLGSHCSAGTGSPVSLSSWTMHSFRIGLADAVGLPKPSVVILVTCPEAPVPRRWEASYLKASFTLVDA